MIEIKPALTGIEWAGALENTFVRQLMLKESCDPVKGNDHIRAALTLYGQPFGFTRNDVVELASVAAFICQDMPLGLNRADAAALASIADRIEALLPPESASPHLEKEIK